MQQNTGLQPISQLKDTLGNVNVKQRFNEVLGDKSAAFMSSIVNVVNSSAALKQCDTNSIIGAAFVAATMDLPIDPSLGFAALVPYDLSKKDENGRFYRVKACQFQIMYRGLVQLAIRSGQYEEMNATEIYEDELIEYNPIRGTCRFSDVHVQRMNGEKDKVVGYYAWFRLRTGFIKEVYMTKAQVEAHALRYSQSYRSDVNYGKTTSRWSQDFDAMGRKTVLKSLLSKWGPLSIDMQAAVAKDQMVYTDIDKGEYSDNPPFVESVEDETPNPFEIKEDAVQDVQEPQQEPRQEPVAEASPVTATVQVFDTDLPFV